MKSENATMEVIMDLMVDCLRTTHSGTEQREDMQDKLNSIERKHRNNKTAWKQALETVLEETA